MCGIAGYLSSNTPEHPMQILEKMGKTIVHRGPDDRGVWFDREAGIGLCSQRLSVVDLSPAGHQPMISSSGRFVLVFNGEIYNHLSLRDELQKKAGHLPWRGHSDTETLLAGFEIWGIESTVKMSIGMFAFAVWDRQQHTLTLGRDRIGEKPLYYGWQNNIFLFGSELKALKAHPAFQGEVDRNALSLLIRYRYIPAPYSIYRSIKKLSPGCLLVTSLKDPHADPQAYWDIEQVAADGMLRPFTGSPDEAVESLDKLLRDAVSLQMSADVPVGAFLSGGIDSSTIVALMQAQSSRKVQTFTIGFHEEKFNEAPFAQAIAKHLGTDHHELYVTSQQALDLIPRLPYLYSEPFADPSQIPTFLVSQLARQHVTVSLSGDAGDELFGGYDRYLNGRKIWDQSAFLPQIFKKNIINTLGKLSSSQWNNLLRLWPSEGNRGEKIRFYLQLLCNYPTSLELYRRIMSNWSDHPDLVIGAFEPPTALTKQAPASSFKDFIHQMMVVDTHTFLPDGILCKVDRAAMGVSLETRVPLLDHRIVEFAWKLPLNYKVRKGVTKWCLRQVLHKYVPQGLIERPKMGFSTPLDHWLRGPLREWAEHLLNESRLRKEGYFHVKPIQEYWQYQLSGKKNASRRLWTVLMFQAWLDQIQ